MLGALQTRKGEIRLDQLHREKLARQRRLFMRRSYDDLPAYDRCSNRLQCTL